MQQFRKITALPYDFFAPLLLLAALCVIEIQQNVLPTHDAFGTYQLYYVFYSHYYYQNNILQWLPYGTYGIPSLSYQFFILSPTMYSAAIIGKWLHITNALTLYKVAMYLNFLIFLSGSYLLLKLFTTNRAIRLLIMLASLANLTWQWEVALGFQMYCLIPYMLYSIIKLDQTIKVKWLYFFLIVFLMNLIGNTIYLTIVQGYALLFFFIYLFITNQQLRNTLLSIRNLFVSYYALAFLLLLVFFGLLMYEATHAIVNISPGRSNYTSTLTSFLTYGFQPFGTILFGYLSGAATVYVNTFYVSLLVLVAFVAGLFQCKQRYFIALTISILFLIWLSCGGIMASIAYYLPAMKYYRHISLTYSLVSCFILFAAALSLDMFYKKFTGQTVEILTGTSLIKRRKIMLIILSLIFLDLLFAYYWHLHSLNTILNLLLNLSAWETNILNKHINIYQVLFFARIILYTSWAILFSKYIKHSHVKQPNKLKIYLFALVVIAIFDITSYKFAQLNELKHSFPQASYADSQIEKLEYRSHRSQDSLSVLNDSQQQRFQDTLHMLDTVKDSLGERSALYGLPTYMYSSLDPCFSLWRNDMVAPSVLQITNRVNATFQNGSSTNLALKNIIGCDTPKLRLMSTYQENSIELSGSIVVNNFSGDSIAIKVKNNSSKAAYLIYADAQAQGWHAYIDAGTTPIYTTPDGFKAILIPPGEHNILLSFSNVRYTVYSLLLVAISILFQMVLLALLGCSFKKSFNNESGLK